MAKPKNYEEALEQVNVAKEGLKEAKVAVREFRTENKIKRGKEPEDAKLKASLAKLEKAVETAKEKLEASRADAKELKPRKQRATIYDYPADCVTDADKKKYRAKMRREKRKAEKAEEGGEEKKAPAKKKVVKKKPAATEED